MLKHVRYYTNKPEYHFRIERTDFSDYTIEFTKYASISIVGEMIPTRREADSIIRGICIAMDLNLVKIEESYT